MRRIGLLVLFATSAARADDPRDLFGLPKKHADKPVDCSDGTAFDCVTATAPLGDAPAPYALAQWLSASYLLSLPVADATHDQVAHYALGAARDDAGPIFRGATGLENRWTIDGAPADSVRTGVVDTRVPLAFMSGMWVTAGGFAARDRTSTGGTIDAQLLGGTEHHEIDARAWFGWSAPGRHTPSVANTYQIRRGKIDTGPTLTASVVATGPLADHVWYAAGIAPSLTGYELTLDASRLVDANGDNIPDGFPGLVTTDLIQSDRVHPITYFIPAMARAGIDRGAHHLEVTLIGNASSDTRYLFNSTLQAGGVDRTSLVGDAIATWHGTWHDTHARVQASWHRSSRSESARSHAAADIPQLLSAYVPGVLPDDPQLAAACADSPSAMFTHCPVPAGWFTSAGAGPLTSTTADRPTLTADIAHQTGNHVLRAGVTGEDARLTTETRFTGNAQLRSLFPGEISTRHFLDADVACPSDPNQPCTYADESTLTYRTRYSAAYVEDTWRASSSAVVDGGLRWELMWVGPALHFTNELAPRLGIAIDPLGGGTSRLWASMGRSFALLPAGLGQTILGHARTVDDFSSSFGKSRSVDTGAPAPVADGIAPVSQDELTAGFEVAIARAVRATVWIQGAWLHRGIETVAGVLDNPDQQAAERQTRIFAAEIATAPTEQLVLRAGWMWGGTVGSWPGPYNPREGAALYDGTDYDTQPVNLVGPLPTSIGQRLYIEGSRRGHLAGIEVAVATRLTVASGRPRDVVADTGEGVVYLLPRGAFGRGPQITQANVRLAATWRGLDITLDIFELFDRRTVTDVDPFYTSGAVRPIVGGTPDDLVFLHDDDGRPAVRRTGFGVPTGYQAPVSAVLGVHHSF